MLYSIKALWPKSYFSWLFWLLPKKVRKVRKIIIYSSFTGKAEALKI